MRITVPNLLFFGTIGFLADLFNFAGAQAEILAATFVFKATGGQLGILGAFSSLFYALPTLMMGLVSERIGRRPLVIAAIVGMGTSYAWGACATSIRELYAVATLRAISTAMLWPPTMAWMARAVSPDKFSRFLGAYNVSWAIGTFFGFWGSGYLFEKVGWTSPFWSSAGVAVALLIFVVCTKPQGGEGSPSSSASDAINHHGLNDSQACYFVRLGLVMAVAGMLSTAISLYIFPKVAQGILTEVQISFLNSVRLIGQMLAFFLMGKYGIWHFRKWPVWTMAAIISAGLLLAATGYVYTQFMIGFLFVGFGFGAGFTMCGYYALGLSKTKGMGSGLMETTIGVGGLSGSLLGGVVSYYANARTSLVTGLVPVVVCAFICTRNWKGSTAQEDDLPPGSRDFSG